MTKSISRREFLKGAAAGAVGVTTAGLLGACDAAAESTGSAKFEDTFTWDAEYDVVIIGFGHAGGNSAIAACEAGAKVLICEAAPEGKEGGCSRVCGQFCQTTYDPDRMYLYMTNLFKDHTTDIDFDLVRVYCDMIVDTPNWMNETLGIPKEEINMDNSLGAEFPDCEGGDALYFARVGPYYSIVNENVRKREIDVWFESPGKKLIQDPETKTIIGMVAEKDGTDTYIRAKKGVIMCCGGFEFNQQMISSYIGIYQNFHFARYNTGAGYKMAQEVGAQLWHMSQYAGPYEIYVPKGATPETYEIITDGESIIGRLGILVGPNGRRFMDESYRHKHGMRRQGGFWIHWTLPNPCWAIFDQDIFDDPDALNEIWSISEEQRVAYVEDGTIRKAEKIEELAALIDVDAEGLANTVAGYNECYEKGIDAQYERPADKIVPIVKAPFYAIQVAPMVLNTHGGPKRNTDAQILDLDGNPIPHLYSAGEFGSLWGACYNAGGNVGECTVFGRIAGTNAAANEDI